MDIVDRKTDEFLPVIIICIFIRVTLELLRKKVPLYTYFIQYFIFFLSHVLSNIFMLTITHLCFCFSTHANILTSVRACHVEGIGVRYSNGFLDQLALELVEAVAYRRLLKKRDQHDDSYEWSGRCTFIYPNSTYTKGRRILTPHSMTMCYLDEVEANRWYQMRLRWNREVKCEETSSAKLPTPLTKTITWGGPDVCPGRCFQ